MTTQSNIKGSNWLALHPQRFAARLARQSVAGRQFAMMAAQGVDMMFTLCFGVLVFFNVVVYGTKSGAYLVYFRSVISRISFNCRKSLWYVIVTCNGVCALTIELLETIAVCL